MNKINSLDDLKALQKKILDKQKEFSSTITICGGTGCRASRSKDVIEAVKKEIADQGMQEIV